MAFSLRKTTFLCRERARNFVKKKRLPKVLKFDLKMLYLSKTGPNDSN